MESFTLYIFASIALILTPGPDIIYVLTRGITDGKSAGVMSAVGVTAGILIHTLAASLGLALLLKTSELAFWAIKTAGGIYLLYMGFQVLRNRKAFEVDASMDSFDRKKCFTQGFLTNLLNPKIALFFVAFLPQFVNMNDPNHSIHMILLGIMYAVMTIAFLSMLGLFAGTIGTWLAKRQNVSNKIRLGSGTVILLLGIRLLMPNQN